VATDERLRAVLGLSLGLWVVGVQTHEALATTGGWLTTTLALALNFRARGALVDAGRSWWALTAFLTWTLIGPAALGHLPTGSGVARTLDVLLVPGALLACRALPEKTLWRVAIAGGATLLLSGFVAGLQHFGAWPRAEAFEALRWTRLPFERVYETVPGRDDRFMAGGLLLHRLRFANVTSALTVLAFAGALRLPGRRAFLSIVALAGVTSVAIFPHARAALVSLVLALLVVAGLGASRKRVALALGAAVVGLVTLLVLVTPSMRSRLGAAMDAEGTGDRVLLVNAGLAAVKQAPVSGVGLGRFKPGDWAGPDAPASVRAHQGKAHNQFLSLAAEGGVLSPALLLAFLAFVAAQARKDLPDSAATFGALALLLALSALHDPLFHAESSMALFGSLGAALGLSRRAA